MRIGIDFHSAEGEGSGNCSYNRNLMESILALDRESKCLLYVPDANHPGYHRFRDKAGVRLQPLMSKNVLEPILTSREP
jgi:hypothetical protein